MDEIAKPALPPQPLDRLRQAAPQIADTLREQILDLTLPPGTVLARAELAARFGVSQTPVRDALGKLGEDGLVDIYPQHATLVSRIDVGAARRTLFLRRALELEVVHVLASLSAQALAGVLPGLHACMAEQKRALAAKDLAAFSRADQALHLAMAQAAGVGELWPLVRQRSGHGDRLRRLHLPAKGKAQAVLRDHQAILLAIQARKSAAAQAALRAHLAGTLAFVDEVRQRHPDWLVG